MRTRYVALLFCMPMLTSLACTDPVEPPVPIDVHFSVAILGTASDSRIPAIREALAHWNDEFERLRVGVALDTGVIRDRSMTDAQLRTASDEVLSGNFSGPGVSALRTDAAAAPTDIVIELSGTDLISFALTWGADRQGIVVLRRSDITPLSLPNALRNVVAHELGHVFGLGHNSDPTTLMCGRPASCRPDAFASSTPHFFPLTAADEQLLKQRSWP